MTAPPHLESREVEVPPTLAVQLAGSCSTDAEAIATAMRRSFATLGMFMGRNGLVPSGPPRTIYTAWGRTSMSFILAFPIASYPAAIETSAGIAIGTLAGGRALRFVHHGPYDTIQTTYARIDAWLREHGAIRTDADWARYSGMWEEYLNEPGKVPDSELMTSVYLPLRDSDQDAS